VQERHFRHRVLHVRGRRQTLKPLTSKPHSPALDAAVELTGRSKPSRVKFFHVTRQSNVRTLPRLNPKLGLAVSMAGRAAPPPRAAASATCAESTHVAEPGLASGWQEGARQYWEASVGAHGAGVCGARVCVGGEGRAGAREQGVSSQRARRGC
jgi:hypothetical protein